MSRRVAAHVTITDRRAPSSVTAAALLVRAQAVLADAGIGLDLELVYDLDDAADRALAEGSPPLTALRAERDGGRVIRGAELELIAGELRAS